MSALPDSAAGMEIPPAEVAALVASIAAGDIRLVDCREEEEWHFNRLPGASWFPLSRFAGNPPPGDIPVIVYCHHGMRSLRAAAWLRSRGNPRAWSMSGGIDQWSKEIDPAVPVY